MVLVSRYRNVRTRGWTSRKGLLAAGRKKARQAIARAARQTDVVMANAAERGLSLSRGEFKSVDTNNVNAANTATAVFLLNGIARGDDINERTGREVVLRSILVKAFCYVTAGTGVDQMQRVLVVYDRQTNAAALTAAQVLSVANTMAPRNLENRRRFTILMDRTVTLNATAESGSFRLIKFYRHLRHPMEFNSGDAGTVADITTGSIYTIVIGTEVAGDTAGSVLINTRIRYEDK